MTGLLTTVGGDVWQLPPLLEWDILRTDGSSCDSAKFTFLYEPKRLDVLRKATRFRLTEDGKTVLCGVVDEFTAEVGEQGRIVTMTGRGMAAVLMDHQLRATVYAYLQKEDALRHFARDLGITVGPGGQFPAVSNFSVGTGCSAWQALCGFCRHSNESRPRFTNDGTLLPDGGTPSTWKLTQTAAFRRLRLRQCRYGVLARQILISAKTGAVEQAENAAFLKLGGTAQKVGMKTGAVLDANFRTAKQRIADSAEEALLVTVTMAGMQWIEPGDRVMADWPDHGVDGTFFLRSRRDVYANGQRTCTLELKGAIG